MQRQVCVLLALCFAALPAFAAITGVVMTTDGQPIAGARVWVRPVETSEQRAARLQSASPELVPLAAGQTDAKGTFAVESPKAAVVDVAISAAGYEPTQRRVERDEEMGAIALSKGEMRTATITANGKPVAGAWVALNINGFEHVVKTDEQGRYQAPDPKRLRSYIVLHPDYAVLQGTATSATTSASDLNYKLTAGKAITGRVVDGSDKPVAGAQVLVDNWPVTTSGEDGSFTIAHMPARWSALTAKKDSLLAYRAESKDTNFTLKLARGATVSGRITDAKTKMPVVSASVMLAPGPMRGMTRQNSTSVLTDAKGAFSAVVPAGSYMLWAQHPGYSSSPNDVSVTAGQALQKDITLNPAARISGVVVDESKNPVVAAIVSADAAEQPFMGSMRVMSDASAISGPDGRFTVRAELDRDVTVRAVKKGLPAAKTESMKLAAGERKSGVVVVIPSGIAVSGRVTDMNDNPLSGIAVTASEAEPGRGGMMTRMIMLGGPQREDDAVRTASDGTFTLRVKEGTYDFAFRGDGFAPKFVRGQTVSATSSPAVDASMEPAADVTGRVVRGGVGIENANVMAFGGPEARTVTGPDGSFTITGLPAGPTRLMVSKTDEFIQEMRNVEAPARDVVIEVRAGGRVTGRVVEKDSSKPVTAFQAGVSTSRGGPGGMFLGPPQLREFTSEDGSFVLENVPAGAMTLVVNAPGYASGRMNVTIEEGKTLSDVELQLETGVKLVGRVTTTSGQALADVSVMVAPSPTGNFASSGMRRSATTDANGEYVLDALEAGEETIQFSHPKYTATRKTVTLKGRETRLDMQLTSGTKLTGVVVTEAGAPVADASVELRGASFNRARTDANGAFEIDSVSPGRYTITASKTGFAEGVLEDFDATSGSPARIVLKTGGSIAGRVIGLSQQELLNVEVNAYGRGGSGGMASGSVDGQGNFRIDGAPLGSVQVQARVLSRATFESKQSRIYTVEVTPGGSAQLDIEFRGDVAVRGRVTKNGVPLRGGSISFWPKGGATTRAGGNAPIDESGMYSITGLEDGEYDVSISDANRGNHRTTYVVRGSGSFDIDYKTGMVRGRVLDVANNEPLTNVSVQLRGSTTDFRGGHGGVTDSNGTFVIDSVPPGTYTVTASKDGYGNHMQDIVVSEPGVDNLEVRLARNEGVALRVVDARDGRAITASVTVYDMQGRVVHESRLMMFGGGIDASDVRLPLNPGQYSAMVSAMNYAPRNISITSPSPQAHVVQLSPGGTLQLMSKHSTARRVRVVDANGLPYPRYSWSQWQTRELLPSPAPTTYPNVASGSYTVQLLDENNNVVDSRQVVVSDGQTSTVEI